MSAAADRLRIDVWLWRARFAKTRSGAAALVAAGGVRLTHEGQSRRLEKASAAVAVGDLITFPQGASLRCIEVVGLGARRGPAAEARSLYRDLGAHLPIEPDPLA